MPNRITENFACTMPWRTGNQLELLADGNHFFPRILAAFDAANASIDVEMYLFESGHITSLAISHLGAAVERGVRVRLLLDHFGSYRLSQSDIQRIRSLDIELRFFNPIRRRKWLLNLSRDHRKLIIIDRAVAFVGGAGFTDEFSVRVSGKKAWRELMVEIKGPVLNDWQILFERVWSNHDAIQSEILRERILLSLHQPTYNMHHDNREVPQVRVNATRGLGNKPIMGALLSEIKKSHTRIWISTAYFYPPSKLLKALRKAAMRGIEVRILLPGPYTDHPGVRYAGHSWYTQLLRDNVHIHEYQPRFLHMKLALVDDWCSFGSCNFDRWNLHWNLEANLEVIDQAFSDNVKAMLINDFAESVEYQLAAWKQRPWWIKARERFWKYIALILSRLTNQ